MGRTHELRMQSQGTSWSSVIGGSALVLVAAASLVLVLHPTAAHELSRLYASLRATGQLTALGNSVLRASVAAGCASATIYVLVGFARGVQRAPFLWLSPVLVGFGMAVMLSMRMRPPLPMSETMFYVASALVLLGGGGLMQRHGWQYTFAGTALTLLPFGTLIGGYIQKAGGALLPLAQLSSGATLHALVLLVLSFGIGFIAFTTRDERTVESRIGRRRHGRHAEGDALEEALERARVSEIRVQASEERVSIAHQQLRMQAEELEAALAIQDDVKSLAPRRLAVRFLITGFALIAVVGAFMGAFVGLYRPLQLRAATAQALAVHLEQERQQVATGFAAERAALLADVEKARLAGAEAQAATTKLQAEMTALLAAQTPIEAATAEPPPVVAAAAVAHVERAAPSRKVRAAKRKRVVAARTAPRERPAAASTPAREAAEMNDDPIAGLDL